MVLIFGYILNQLTNFIYLIYYKYNIGDGMKEIICIEHIVEFETQIYKEFDNDCKKSILEELTNKAKPSFLEKLFKSKVEEKSNHQSKINSLTRWVQKLVVDAHQSALDDLEENDTDESTYNIIKLMGDFGLLKNDIKDKFVSKELHIEFNAYNVALIESLDIGKLSDKNIIIKVELGLMGMSFESLVAHYFKQREIIVNKLLK